MIKRTGSTIRPPSFKPPTPSAARLALPIPTVPESVERVSEFLSPGKALVLTGAGVSVDSGIRAYRGEGGRYLNPNYVPILYKQLIDPSPTGHSFRQRYWARSYLGYPPVRDAIPNPIHFSIAALQRASFVEQVITQNVDGLHLKASGVPVDSQAPPGILQLHGTLHLVHCRRGHTWDRASYQNRLEEYNPLWKLLAEKVGQELRTNPDGDVEVHDMDFATFNLPPCERCTEEGLLQTVIKPDVTFFGESIHDDIKQLSFEAVDQASRLLIVGTTMTTWSAFRLVRHAVDLNKPVLLLNVGTTRADELDGMDKIPLPAGDVMKGAAQALCGAIAQADVVLESMLESGVVRTVLNGDPGSA